MSEDNDKFETALRAVIDELKAPKGQYNSFGKYSYRNAEDILEAVKPLLSAAKLRLKTSDDVVQVGERYYVRSTVTVIGFGATDTATGYAREAETKKGMDESQITGAASSYAKKYALNDMFDIDDTKDADSQDNSKSEKKTATTGATDNQVTLIRTLAREIGTPDDAIEARLAQIKTSAEASEAIKRLKGEL